MKAELIKHFFAFTAYGTLDVEKIEQNLKSIRQIEFHMTPCVGQCGPASGHPAQAKHLAMNISMTN